MDFFFLVECLGGFLALQLNKAVLEILNAVTQVLRFELEQAVAVPYGLREHYFRTAK